MIKKDSDKYIGIVDMLRKGRGFAAIRNQWKCSNDTIAMIRSGEDIEPNQAGRPSAPALVFDPSYEKRKSQQGGLCEYCGEPLPTGVENPGVCRPGGTERICIACDRCWKITSLLRSVGGDWNPLILIRLEADRVRYTAEAEQWIASEWAPELWVKPSKPDDNYRLVDGKYVPVDLTDDQS